MEKHKLAPAKSSGHLHAHSLYSVAGSLFDPALRRQAFTEPAQRGWDQPDGAGNESPTHERALEWLACRLAAVKEDERHKIAEQLHDEFGQELLLAKLKLGQLSDALPLQHRGCVNEVIGIISDAIRHTRTVIHDLYPQQLYEIGLNAALQSLAEELQLKHGLICATSLDPAPNPLEEQIQQVLFRAVRELLLNVVKHAQATRADIIMRSQQNLLVIEVCDNGQGFNYHKTASSNLTIGRFGLFSVRAQLATISGSLRIVSRAGSGTRAIITVLLKPN